MSVARRFDRIEAPQWASTKFEKTPEGYLKGRAAVTNIGVFPYLQADGTVLWELRHPDDVFAPETLESFSMLPVTNEHPGELVTADNIKQYQVGNLGDYAINVDNMYLACDMIIQEKNAIDEVMQGKRALSVGYSCEVVDESGTWLGVPYDRRQKNIRGNHVAIVDKGRAGETAVIKLDAADAILIQDAVPRIVEDIDPKEEFMADLKKIKLDGVEYDAEAAVITALHNATEKADTLQASLDALTAEKSALEAERDTLKVQADEMKGKVAELEAQKADANKINELVLRRVHILDAAKSAGVEIADGMSEQDIQKAVILSVFKTLSLDGKDSVYVDACFDSAVLTLTERADAANRATGTDPVPQTNADEGEKYDADAARKRYLASLTKKEE